MSYSVHTRAVNWSFNPSSPSYAQKKSFSKNLERHVSRDEKNAVEVKKATRSNIDVNATQYNINFIPDTESRFEKAQELINDRIAQRQQGGTSFSSADENRIKKLKTKRKSAQRAYKRAIKSRDEGRTDDAWVQQKLDARTQIEEELDDLRAKKENSKKSYQYEQWDARVGVGGISTLQLSKSTLEKMGWQMRHEEKTIQSGKNKGKKRQERTAFSYEEQAEYEKQHPENNAIKDVTDMYQTMFKAISDKPEKFGTLVSASLHMDESIPHMDYLTLDIGVDLDGKPVDHVGEKDNFTNDDLLNVRHRTYINGTNDKGTLATNYRNSDWGAKLQDDLDVAIKSHLTQHQKNKASDWDLGRGLTKQEHNDQVKEALKTLGIDEDELIDLAKHKKKVEKDLKNQTDESKHNIDIYASSANVVINKSIQNGLAQGSLYASSVDASIAIENKKLHATSVAMYNSSVAMASSSTAMSSSSADMESSSISINDSENELIANLQDFQDDVLKFEQDKKKFRKYAKNVNATAQNNQVLSDFFGEELQNMSKNNPYSDQELKHLKNGGRDKKGKNIVQLIFEKLIKYAENGLTKQIDKFFKRLQNKSESYEQNQIRERNKKQTRIKDNENDGPEM